MGTLWRGRIRFTVPMLFCLAWAFNFLFGGFSGVFMSDVPSDVTTHGSFFVMAHFHYTIMGGLVFTFFAAIYYWVPKMSGFNLNETLGKVHFWTMFIASTRRSRRCSRSAYGHAAARGHLCVSLQPLNVWVSVSAFVLGISMLVFLYNVVWSLLFKREPAAVTRGMRSPRSGSCPRRYRSTTSSDFPCSTPIPIRMASSRLGWGRRPRRPPEVPRRLMEASAPSARFPRHRTRATRVAAPRDLGGRAVCAAGRSRSSSCRSCSPTSTYGRSTPTTPGRSAQ